MSVVHRIVGALALCALAPCASAQSGYPDKPIRMIIPLAAASAVDNAARIVAQRMVDNMGQQIVIENQPGAAGLIGAERVAKAAPDGYTIGGFNDSIMTMLPNLYAKMPWDILKDFEPVSLVATVEWGLVASNDAPYRNAGDLIAAAKANPGKIIYALGRQRQPAAHRDGAVRVERGHLAHARPVQGRDAGRAGRRRRAGAGRLSGTAPRSPRSCAAASFG